MCAYSLHGRGFNDCGKTTFVFTDQGLITIPKKAVCMTFNISPPKALPALGLFLTSRENALVMRQNEVFRPEDGWMVASILHHYSH